MGWYHYEVANGRDPSADDNNDNNNNGGTCKTGTCNSSSSNNTNEAASTVPYCPDGTCTKITPATGTSTTTECSSTPTTTTTTISPTAIDQALNSNSINADADNDGTSTANTNNNTQNTTTTTTSTTSTTTNYAVDVSYEPEVYRDDGPIYHLCDEANWMSAIRIKRAYYPPTYWRDGKFTRGCCQRESLVSTGNEYYKISSGRWIALEINSTMLHETGITIECHRAPESTKDEPIQCLKIYSGITTTIPGFITNIYKMHRNADGTFTGMSLDNTNTIPRVVSQPSQSSTTTTTNTSSVMETAPIPGIKNVNSKNINKEVSTGSKSSKKDVVVTAMPSDDNDTKKRTGLLWMRMSRRKSNV